MGKNTKENKAGGQNPTGECGELSSYAAVRRPVGALATSSGTDCKISN